MQILGIELHKPSAKDLKGAINMAVVAGGIMFLLALMEVVTYRSVFLISLGAFLGTILGSIGIDPKTQGIRAWGAFLILSTMVFLGSELTMVYVNQANRSQALDKAMSKSADVKNNEKAMSKSADVKDTKPAESVSLTPTTEQTVVIAPAQAKARAEGSDAEDNKAPETKEVVVTAKRLVDSEDKKLPDDRRAISRDRSLQD